MHRGFSSERSRVRAGLTALIVLGLLASAGAAQARTRLRACGDQGRLTCGRVSVALDPSGRVAGRVSLFVERYAAVAHPSATVLALPGGPGQSGVSLLGDFRDGLRSVLSTDALVTFDERGIGRSGSLDCRVPDGSDLAGSVLSACVRKLGARARFYSSDDTASDIEAIRRALGLGRIDLYGVSYGTFPATEYARRYPSGLAHLVLDSSLPADGDLDVKLNTFTSVRRQLATICTVVCPGLNPAGDFSRFVGRLPRTAPTGDPTGVSRDEAEGILLDILYASDLDPFVRASIPAALKLGADGDNSAIIRLGSIAAVSEAGDPDDAPAVTGGGPVVKTAGPVPEAAGPVPEAAGPVPEGGVTARAKRASTVVVDAEGVATRCEDERFVWSSGDSLAVRRAKVRREQAGLSPAEVAPFTAGTAIDGSGIANCERWPDAGDHPARERRALPAVPTLILSGEDDVRTPLEQAQTLAGQIPGSILLPVAGVGHAVLVNDSTGCAKRAVAAFLTGAPVLQCTAPAPTPVDPLPPGSFAALAPSGGQSGEPGEVLTASVLTLHHDVGFISPYAFGGLAVPGTIAGGLLYFAVAKRPGVLLEDISYVPSVSLTGELTLGTKDYGAGRVTVKVSGHDYGVLRLSGSGAITGRLGGAVVNVSGAGRTAINLANGLGFVDQLR
ncbi:MAG TPA: alpha/beta fold hydrolase [Solirubrobacteraceae bacterium]|nr:alpha/beta fold hydrolase [Solirubrobacteraceae bacterium]